MNILQMRHACSVRYRYFREKSASEGRIRDVATAMNTVILFFHREFLSSNGHKITNIPRHLQRIIFRINFSVQKAPFDFYCGMFYVIIIPYF